VNVSDLIQGLFSLPLEPGMEIQAVIGDHLDTVRGIAIEDGAVVFYNWEHGWRPKRILPWPLREMADALHAGMTELSRVQHEQQQIEWDRIAREMGERF
jgi:hypothetical protein